MKKYSVIQWTGNNRDDVKEFCSGGVALEPIGNNLMITTARGGMFARKNDRIIKVGNYILPPMKDDIFKILFF